jgi:hypothetical protein
MTSPASGMSTGGTLRLECLGGLHVDDQLELGRLLDRLVGRFGPGGDFSDKGADPTLHVSS